MARRRLWRNSSLLGLVVPRGASQGEARPVQWPVPIGDNGAGHAHRRRWLRRYWWRAGAI